MAAEKPWTHYFKPEVRKQGTDAFESGAVYLSISGDTRIEAFVKAGSPVKVSLIAESIESPLFTASCPCTSSSKGQFCKHIWATLLEVEKSFPDFLDSKTEIEKGTSVARTAFKPAPRPAAAAASPAQSAQQTERHEAMKARQADYRKAQYQKQKLRAKDIKAAKKNEGKPSKFAPPTPDVPEDVAEALKYFEDNGFPLEVPFSKDAVANARKILARVFHPDKGGTHEETLALNQNYDILVEFQKSL